MPQPLSKVMPNAKLGADVSDALKACPELAIYSATILSSSAKIDVQLATLMIKIIGLENDAALAVFDILRAASLQKLALDAAAKAGFNEQDFRIFSALTSAAETAQKERHRLAHWIWAASDDVPKSLLLIDPKAEKLRGENLVRQLEALHNSRPKPPGSISVNSADVLVYGLNDLLRANRDLLEVDCAFLEYHFYRWPAKSIKADRHQDYGSSEGALQKLTSRRPIAEALARYDAKGQSAPKAQP